jgi:hypothetical protein
MIHDLGTDPALDVDADQRAELLQKWHRDGNASRYGTEPDVEGDLEDLDP